MKKTLLSLISNLLLFALFLNISPNVLAMSSVNESTSNERTIKIKSNKGFLYKKSANGFEMETRKRKRQEQIKAMSIEELKKIMEGKNYEDRVWAYLRYQLKAKERKYIELPKRGEKGWDEIIEKFLVDLKLVSDPDENMSTFGIYESFVLLALVGLGEEIVLYFEKNELFKYDNYFVKRRLLAVLKNISKNRKDLIPRILGIIEKVNNDKNEVLQNTAKDTMQKIKEIEKGK